MVFLEILNLPLEVLLALLCLIKGAGNFNKRGNCYRFFHLDNLHEMKCKTGLQFFADQAPNYQLAGLTTAVADIIRQI